MTGCDKRTAFQGENFSLNNSRGIPLNNLGLRSSVNYDKDQPDFGGFMSCQVAHLVLLFFITGDFSLCIIYLAKLGDNRT